MRPFNSFYSFIEGVPSKVIGTDLSTLQIHPNILPNLSHLSLLASSKTDFTVGWIISLSQRVVWVA